MEEVERAAQGIIRELGAEVSDSWWDFVESGFEAGYRIVDQSPDSPSVESDCNFPQADMSVLITRQRVHRRFAAYREPLGRRLRDLPGQWIDAAVASSQLKVGIAEPRGLQRFPFA